MKTEKTRAEIDSNEAEAPSDSVEAAARANEADKADRARRIEALKLRGIDFGAYGDKLPEI